ncbi:MAG: hypothetical protein G01um101466_187 [Parcubacteria group bacterium Gr01-1014_66]|nr:MAG: hypothetical protein G01um101466_187 [Parcubacteria group bacterium Gr01-1014_66]
MVSPSLSFMQHILNRRMKRFFSLFIFIFLASAPAIAFAVNSVTIDENTTLVLPSDSSIYTLWANSKFDELTINNDSFAFTLGESGKIEITSLDRKKLTSTVTATTKCETDRSYLSLETLAGSGTTTATITPSGTCSGAGGGGLASSSGGGGGGGGGSTPPPAVTPPPAPIPQAVLPPSVSSTPLVSFAPIIQQTLKSGSRGNEVRLLQEFLAKDPTLYPEGIVSGNFGALTKAAVQRFQERYGIAKKGDLGYGTVGPKTRAKLKEMSSVAPVLSPPPASLPSTSSQGSGLSSLFTRLLSYGSRHTEVHALQQYFAQNPDLYPEGIVSGYFGRATQAAVERFQERYSIATKGSIGYGVVGPKTRSKLNEFVGRVSAGAGTEQELLQQIENLKKSN